jgi:hypothetical protein
LSTAKRLYTDTVIRVDDFATVNSCSRTIVKDIQDRQTSDKKISGISIYQDQLVYIDDKAVLSNAWAGKLFSRHTLPGARIFAGGKDFSFLISDGKTLTLLNNSENLWSGSLQEDEVRDIIFDEKNNLFLILGKRTITSFNPDTKQAEKIFSGSDLTCFEIIPEKLIVGTQTGTL